jgi:hypothetical protein
MILQTPFKRHAYAKAASVQTPFKRHAYAQFHTLAFKRPTYAKPSRVQTLFKRLHPHTPHTPLACERAFIGRSRLTRPAPAPARASQDEALKPLHRLEARARKANEEGQKNGEHRASLDVVASHVLALRQPPKQREKKAPGSREAIRRSDRHSRLDTVSREPRASAASGFDDAIPW